MINETCTMKKLIKLILFLMIAYPLTGAIFLLARKRATAP